MTKARKIGLGAGAALAVAAAIAVPLALQGGRECSVSRATVAQRQGGCGTDPSARGPLTTKGHVVQADPKVVLVEWGWTGTAFERRVLAAEQAMFRQLPGSSYNAILGQYGIHNDVKLIATVLDRRQPPSHKLTYGDFQAEVLRARSLSGQSVSGTQWIVFPPATANLRDFNNECGEHDYFRHGGQLYVWSVTQPFNTPEYSDPRDSCVEYDGGGGDPIGATTSLTSHEYAEAATDPVYSGGQGWTSPNVADSWNEIGDLCYGQGVVLPGGTAVVQALWSNLGEGPGRSRGCVQTAAGAVPQCVGGDDGGPCAYDFVPSSLTQARRPLPAPPPIQKLERSHRRGR